MARKPVFHWQLPMVTDRFEYRSDTLSRRASPDYAVQVAVAAENNGFESLLLVADHKVHDGWLVAAAAAARTTAIKFIVAFRAGYSLPTLIAQQIETFEALFPGRLSLNVVTGSNSQQQLAYGDVIPKAERYRRTGEFLEIVRADLSGRPFDFEGEFYEVRGGGRPSEGLSMPTVFFGGLSPESLTVGAKYADVQLMYGETPPMVAEHVERVGAEARRYGRDIEFGIRVQVISRDTSEAAWAVTDRILSSLDPADVARRQEVLASRDSVGHRRVQSLNPGSIDREALRPYRGMWSGLGLTGTGGQSTALVGSHEEVADLIEEYMSVGITHFIVSGSPLLEEASTFGEGVAALFL